LLSSILRRERSLRSGEVKVEEDLKLEDDVNDLPIL